ncbi:MAG: DUF423 domain-containing protein [Gammaproteobacteria bacterium]|nr:DUF423 domain-containing protein [Gammaproteobacteria bacterium]
MRRMKNWELFVAGSGGVAGTIAGALGAHALALDPATPAGHSFQTAVNYLLLHAVAMLGLAAYRALQPRPVLPLTLAAVLFTAGMILFSGSLIIATAAGWPALKVSAPWGGCALIAGWAAIAAAALRMRRVAR